MVWVSWPRYIFVFLASFSALWWPNIWPKMGFPELFEKNIGSIHFIPGIYFYWVSLWPLYIFVFLASFLWPSGGQIIGQKWGFRIFLKKKIEAQFISYLAFTLIGWDSWPLYIFVFLASGDQTFGWKRGYLLDISGWGRQWSERGYIVPIYGHSFFLLYLSGISALILHICLILKAMATWPQKSFFFECMITYRSVLIFTNKKIECHVYIIGGLVVCLVYA